MKENKCVALHGLAKNVTEYSAHPKRGWNEKAEFLIDYSESLKNYQSNLEIDSIPLYFHTYDSSLLSENQIVSDFKPVKYSITEPIVYPKNKDKQKRINSKINSIEKVFNLISLTKYDYIILTRFDLRFKKNVLNLINEPINKITFGFYCGNGTPEGYVDDNFMIIPTNKINFFLKVIKSIEHKNMHPVGKKIKDFGSQYDLLIPERYHIWENPLYDIVKIKVA